MLASDERDIFTEDTVLEPEASADVAGDRADLLHRDVELGGHQQTHHVRGLRRGVERELFARPDPSRRSTRGLPWAPAGGDARKPWRETTRSALANTASMSPISISSGHRDVVSELLEQRRARRIESIGVGDDRIEHLDVFDDQLERVLGDGAALGDHHRDRVADVAHLVGGQAVERRDLHARHRVHADRRARRDPRSSAPPCRRRCRRRRRRAAHAPRWRRHRAGARGARCCAGTRRAACPAARRRRCNGRGRSGCEGPPTAAPGPRRCAHRRRSQHRSFLADAPAGERARPPRCSGSRCSGRCCPRAPPAPSSRRRPGRRAAEPASTSRSRACRTRTGTRCVSRNACCSGCRVSPSARPSTVTTSLPSACTASIRQERTGSPSTSTVHAPHTPCSQPRCVPVSSQLLPQEVGERSPHIGGSLRGRPR